jgi:hypothetical protein
MMEKNPVSVKKVLTARFHRKGGSSSFTKPFEDFQEEIRESLLSAAKLQQDEFPIIASYLNKDQWLLVTTERVVWLLAGSLHSINKTDINDVIIDPVLEHRLEIRKKNDFTHLVIIDKLDNRHLSKVEPGKALFAVLNVIKFL